MRLAVGLAAAAGALAAPEGCVPVTGDYAFSFPYDFGVHVPQQYEWTWYFGSVWTAAPESRHFGVMMGISRISGECTSISDSLFTTGISVSDSAGDAYYYTMSYDLGSRVNASAAGAASLVEAGRKWSVVQSAADSAQFQMTTLMDGVGFDLALHEDIPVTLMGRDGFDVDEDYVPQTAHIAQTWLSAEGSVTLPSGDEFEVDGTLWMQHEWGVAGNSSGSGTTPGRYDWITAQLDNQIGIVVVDRAPYDVYNDTTPYSSVSIANWPGSVDGKVLWLDHEQWTMERGDEWTSPHSGEVWELWHRLEVPALGLVVDWQTVIDDNEVHDSLRNRTALEAASYVNATIAGEEVAGMGWTGLNHELLGG